MGLYDRDYERSYDTGSGWRDGGGPAGGGFGAWSANSKLMALIAGVYVLQLLSKGVVTEFLELPSDWFSQPWRVYSLFTYSLLHSEQNISHIVFNCLGLFFFGRSINGRLGDREYWLFFFSAAAFAGLAWSLTAVIESDPSAVVGASGGIAAIIILFALWYPNAQVYAMGVLPLPAWLMAVLFIGINAFYTVNPDSEATVAYTSHLGGALFGYLYHRFGWRLSDWAPSSLGGAGAVGDLFKRKPKLRVHRADDDEPAVDPGDERVDEILRKIQAEGQDSLTREEQRLLERASRRYQQRRR